MKDLYFIFACFIHFFWTLLSESNITVLFWCDHFREMAKKMQRFLGTYIAKILAHKMKWTHNYVFIFYANEENVKMEISHFCQSKLNKYYVMNLIHFQRSHSVYIHSALQLRFHLFMQINNSSRFFFICFAFFYCLLAYCWPPTMLSQHNWKIE